MVHNLEYLHKFRLFIKTNYFQLWLGFPSRAQSGLVETTIRPSFYDITAKIDTKPPGTEHIFLVDMPGIGGLNVNSAGYFRNYGPGHFDLSFLLAENGYNEFESYFLQHLVRNQKPMILVRTKSDSAITGRV